MPLEYSTFSVRRTPRCHSGAASTSGRRRHRHLWTPPGQDLVLRQHRPRHEVRPSNARQLVGGSAVVAAMWAAVAAPLAKAVAASPHADRREAAARATINHADRRRPAARALVQPPALAARRLGKHNLGVLVTLHLHPSSSAGPPSLQSLCLLAARPPAQPALMMARRLPRCPALAVLGVWPPPCRRWPQ